MRRTIGKAFGLDAATLLHHNGEDRKQRRDLGIDMTAENLDRRSFLKTCAFTTGVAGLSREEKTLLAQQARTMDPKPPAASIGLPMGRIGKLKISRLICGGNLINGYAHARDMIYMKTLHSPNYWSATPEDKKGPYDLPAHDNMWCMEPERTIEFMKTCAKPWIAYKVLAAGAIQPIDGFKYAFENGADFACVGMCDFQIREDAIIANKVLTNLTRPRPWRG